VTSPLNGRVGLRLVDVGNIVNASSQTGLVVITEVEPIAVLFTVPEDTLRMLLPKIRDNVNLPVDAYDRSGATKIETGKVLRIFTNDLQASAQEIADLYKRRWAIELFFRWVKQTLKIGHFLGTSENAVRIQITIALIAFLLLRLAHDAHKIVASPLAFARLIRTNLMMRRQIAELLQSQSPPIPELQQGRFEFGLHATRAVHRRRARRSNCAPMKEAA
jgi:hypothetical protein